MSESEAVATLRETLEKDLQEIFGSYKVDKDGDFMVEHEGTVTWIRPVPWGENETIVRIWSITNVGVRVDPELTQFLITENAKVVFGGFVLDESKPAVLFQHTLLGDFLQRKELEVAIAAVVVTANQYDDMIKERFGGTKFTEQ